MALKVALTIVLWLSGTAYAQNYIDEILVRCEASMRQYGAAMVKACVDQDDAARAALERYPSASSAAIARCERSMKQYGWTMVKACADQDITAAAALGKYPPSSRAAVERCQHVMGQYGAAMVKACADQDLQADEQLRARQR